MGNKLKINNSHLYEKWITWNDVLDTTGDLRFIFFQMPMVTRVNNQYEVIPNIICNFSTIYTSVLREKKYINGNWYEISNYITLI